MSLKSFLLSKILWVIGFDFVLYDNPVITGRFLHSLSLYVNYTICLINTVLLVRGDTIGMMQAFTSIGYYIMVRK